MRQVAGIQITDVTTIFTDPDGADDISLRVKISFANNEVVVSMYGGGLLIGTDALPGQNGSSLACNVDLIVIKTDTNLIRSLRLLSLCLSEGK